MKKIISVAAALLACTTISLCACAEASVKVVDNANIFSEKDESKLTKKLEDFSEDYGVDAVVYTTSDLGEKSIGEFAGEKTVEVSLGKGSSNDGIMLVVCSKGDGDICIAVNGGAYNSINSYGQNRIKELVSEDFKANEYLDGCNQWLKLSGKFIKRGESGKPYNEENKYLTLKDKVGRIGYSFAGAFVISLIICLIMSGMMKTANPKHTANDYVDKKSFKLSKERDVYLYTTETRTKRETKNKE